MKRYLKIAVRCMLVLTFAAAAACAQDASRQEPTESQAPGAPPPPAFGQNNPPQAPESNPPVSGLDQPALEPGVAPRSFIIPGLHFSEAADSNVGSSTGDASVHGITRALGSIALQRLWSRYDVGVDYVGGAAIYVGQRRTFNQVQQLDAQGRLLWRTGQFALRESFSYLPEGSFGYGSYAGSGGYQLGLGGIGGVGGGITAGPLAGFFGGGQFGSLGQTPRITDMTLGEFSENLSPRSSVTLAGSYGLVHFTDDAAGFINSRQISGQAGYNYQINRRDQLSIVYGYQGFRYPNLAGESFTTNLWNVLYGHRISGRLDLVVGGGPQMTSIDNPQVGNTQRISFSGRGSLRYRFPKTNLGLFYSHYNTNGSGFFAGAKSDIVRLAVTRPIGRVWDAILDVGYTHNSQIQPSIIGVQASSYNYGYAGGGMHRQLGQNFSVFVSYQFNDLAFDSSFCVAPGPCDRTSRRHVAAVGLDWHPHPIRLD